MCYTKHMNYLELMRTRRSIRKYTTEIIESTLTDQIQEELDKINEESGFYFQIVLNNPQVLGGKLVSLMFENATNVIALVGEDDKSNEEKLVEEKIGYYGARILLFIHSLGLGTCFVTGTYSRGKSRAFVVENQKLYGVISFGFADGSEIKPRKSKSIEEISDYELTDPQWYHDGLQGVLLAPTSVNIQPFKFTIKDRNNIHVYPTFGINPVLNCGIAKYFFEKACGTQDYVWTRIHNRDR